MEFSIDRSVEVLERTPLLLTAWLSNLDEGWVSVSEGENGWSVKEVLAHLIVCEQSNWMVRIKILLSDLPDKQFVPIDMKAHFELAKTLSLNRLLSEFAQQRQASINEFRKLNLTAEDMTRSARHPVLAEINLGQLIATWVSHDLSHTAQMARIMAVQYKDAVGPFITFLRFMQKD